MIELLEMLIKLAASFLVLLAIVYAMDHFFPDK